MKRNRRKYEESFKEMAVELCNTGKGTSEVAEELGITSSILGRWKREYRQGEGKFSSGQSKRVLSPDQVEIARLKKALRASELERDILKKAVSIFSRSDGRSTGL